MEKESNIEQPDTKAISNKRKDLLSKVMNAWAEYNQIINNVTEIDSEKQHLTKLEVN